MRFSLFAIFLLSLFSCSGGTENSSPDTVAATDSVNVAPKAGSFTNLSARQDPANTYTLYLPAGYDPQQVYPIVVFFDAHGNGRLPMEKYKPLADKWNFIFAGSNSSRNGMPSNETMRIGNALIDELQLTLPVNRQKILLCGFSGGARVAAMIGTTREDVKGIICNSAAPQATGGKAIIGLAGLGDMNYLEMKKFDDAQPEKDRTFELLVFDGKHEWAPVSVMENALLLATIHLAGKTQLPDSTDYVMAGALHSLVEMQLDSIRKTSCLLEQNWHETSGRVADAYSTWEPLKAPDASCVKREEAQWAKVEEQEAALQEFLSESLLARDTTWWKANAAQYFETDKTGPEKYMRQRLRGYMSLTCYTYAGQAIRMKNLHAAEKMVTLYSIIDPSNSEWAYMRATLYMQLGLDEYAISSLEKAIDLGFRDRNRLQSDPAFAALNTDARFTALFARMNQ